MGFCSTIEETLILGTRQGQLYMYYIVPKDDKPEVSLMRLNKNFSKKPIQQIEVIPKHQLLVSLTGRFFSVFHMKYILSERSSYLTQQNTFLSVCR